MGGGEGVGGGGGGLKEDEQLAAQGPEAQTDPAPPSLVAGLAQC